MQQYKDTPQHFIHLAKMKTQKYNKILQQNKQKENFFVKTSCPRKTKQRTKQNEAIYE